MNKFITVTDVYTGKKVYVNVSNVTKMSTVMVGNKKATRICLTGSTDTYVDATESTDIVIAMAKDEI